jgi:hypothetical protein
MSGVRISGGGTFTMNGGEISGNSPSAYSGGGVLMTNGTFTMNGGKISHNSSSNNGGGVCAIGGTFTMNGGEISNNSCYGYGGGVYVSGATFTKSGGGIITGYDSDTVKGNVVRTKSGVVNDVGGHAVLVTGNNGRKRRGTTAGPGVNLDSRVSGAAGGWEN